MSPVVAKNTMESMKRNNDNENDISSKSEEVKRKVQRNQIIVHHQVSQLNNELHMERFTSSTEVEHAVLK